MGNSKKVQLLSVIVPAYKQEKTIKEDLLQIVDALEQINYEYEIIVVVDGKVDKTEQRAKLLKSSKIQNDVQPQEALYRKRMF